MRFIEGWVIAQTGSRISLTSQASSLRCRMPCFYKRSRLAGSTCYRQQSSAVHLSIINSVEKSGLLIKCSETSDSRLSVIHIIRIHELSVTCLEQLLCLSEYDTYRSADILVSMQQLDGHGDHLSFHLANVGEDLRPERVRERQSSEHLKEFSCLQCLIHIAILVFSCADCSPESKSCKFAIGSIIYP